MEDNRDKKDYKQQNNIQKFYFNDDGQLVVESNKGVWVDGEQYVKMYGNFTCNAKTMGLIISQLKNVPVLTAHETNKVVINSLMDEERLHADRTECIVNPSEEQTGLLTEIKLKEGRIEQLNDNIKKLNKMLDDAYDQRDAEHKAIERFNSLPWYKRIFKKIEIKTN